MRLDNRGFTLIELLVVVTIIVILLALLVPALDKAIYHASFAACGAQQHGIAGGAVQYAMNNKRRYPYRAGTNESTSGNYQPFHVSLPFNPIHNRGNPFGYDDRPLLRPYMNINALVDPLAPDSIDLDGAPSDTFLFGSYNLWFGWKHRGDSNPANAPVTLGRGMDTYGQPWTWNGKKYSVLLSDTHGVWGWGATFYAHADRDGAGTGWVRREEAWNGGPAQGPDKNSLSLWFIGGGRPDGPQFDENFAYEDGSVRAYKDIYADIPWHRNWTRRELRFDTVPMYHSVTSGNQPDNAWLIVPGNN